MLKKILSFFTITILCLGMAGCGSEGNTSKENNTGTTSENYAEEKEGTEAETDNHTIMVTIGAAIGKPFREKEMYNGTF